MSFNLEKQNVFNEIQMFLVLSRLTKTENYFLIGLLILMHLELMKMLSECNSLLENRFDTTYADYAECSKVM